MAITHAISSALSGVHAGERRLANSASNVANPRSAAAASVDGPSTDAEGNPLLRAGRMVDQPGADGGVRSTRLLADPPSVKPHDPSAPDDDADGPVNRPNVAPARANGRAESR